MNPWSRIRNALRSHLTMLNEIHASQEKVREEVRVMHRALDSVRENVFLARIAADSSQMTEIVGADGRYADPKSLARYNQRIYSQVGEDGIIAEIFRRIDPQDRTFLEIGIGDGRENTTRFLLETGWRGTWIEGSPASAESARILMKDYIDDGRLKILQAFVTAENINDILDDAGVPHEFDYLSLDIDYNTGHVWRVLDRSPRVACIEYNSMLPAGTSVIVPYDPTQTWDGTLWFGASLKTMERIGIEKDLSLVGCDLMGVNAFFVATGEATGRFREPFDAEAHFEPARFHALATTPRHAPPDNPRKWVVED